MDKINVSKDFPILKRKINGKRLVYLASAATSQTPLQVLEAIVEYYKNLRSNVHRSLNTLSHEATEKYENARNKIADFVNARPEEIIFVKNATEGLNLIANCYKIFIKKGDVILLTEMEHHSNLIPWQMIAKERNAKLDFIPIREDGTLDMKRFDELINKSPKILAITQVSNVLGTINPLREIIEKAHKKNVVVVVDGAQAVPHMKVDVRELDADFYVFSGHKMLGPTGIGVAYGKKELLEKIGPFLFGGDMIKEVTFENATWNDLPWKFEAGTPNVSGAIGLGAAVDYLNKLGIVNVERYARELTGYALEELRKLGYVKLYGPLDFGKRNGVISFNVGDIHSHDVATVLDTEGIMIRSGHACAMPLMSKLKVDSICRASFYIYNTKDDVDSLINGLKKCKEVFKL